MLALTVRILGFGVSGIIALIGLFVLFAALFASASVASSDVPSDLQAAGVFSIGSFGFAAVLPMFYSSFLLAFITEGTARLIRIDQRFADQETSRSRESRRRSSTRQETISAPASPAPIAAPQPSPWSNPPAPQAPQTGLRTWTMTAGKQFSGTLQSFDGQTAVFVLPGGQQVSARIENLTPESAAAVRAHSAG